MSKETLNFIQKNQTIVMWNLGRTHGPEDPSTSSLVDEGLWHMMPQINAT